MYVQSDTLLVADVFETKQRLLKQMYWNIWISFCSFLSAPELAWQACLKKTEVELELLSDIAMLLMVEKVIRGWICHAIRRYAKTNNEYMKNYIKIKVSIYIMYLDANNLYG